MSCELCIYISLSILIYRPSNETGRSRLNVLRGCTLRAASTRPWCRRGCPAKRTTNKMPSKINSDKCPSTHVTLGQKPPSGWHSTTHRHAFSFLNIVPVDRLPGTRCSRSAYPCIAIGITTSYQSYKTFGHHPVPPLFRFPQLQTLRSVCPRK